MSAPLTGVSQCSPPLGACLCASFARSCCSHEHLWLALAQAARRSVFLLCPPTIPLQRQSKLRLFSFSGHV